MGVGGRSCTHTLQTNTVQTDKYRYRQNKLTPNGFNIVTTTALNNELVWSAFF